MQHLFICVVSVSSSQFVLICLDIYVLIRLLFRTPVIFQRDHPKIFGLRNGRLQRHLGPMAQLLASSGWECLGVVRVCCVWCLGKSCKVEIKTSCSNKSGRHKPLWLFTFVLVLAGMRINIHFQSCWCSDGTSTCCPECPEVIWKFTWRETFFEAPHWPPGWVSPPPSRPGRWAGCFWVFWATSLGESWRWWSLASECWLLLLDKDCFQHPENGEKIVWQDRSKT